MTAWSIPYFTLQVFEQVNGKLVYSSPTFEGTFPDETSGTYPETYNPSPYSLPPLRLNPMKPFVANSKGRFTFLVSALFSK